MTGATGFIGAEVARHLDREGMSVLRGCRAVSAADHRTASWKELGDLSDFMSNPPQLEGIDCVVHCAGLAAVGAAATDRRRATELNVDAAEAIAAASAKAGVKRFVYISSALVLGSTSPPGEYFDDDTPCAPDTPYARTKREAEVRIIAVASRTRLETVILRPPLVYGRGARGNFRRLVDLVRRGVALPFGRADAPRSFIAVENLATAVAAALSHPGAAGGAFLVADAEMSSTRDLIERIARAQKQKVRLIPVPVKLVRSTADVFGAQQMIRQLFDPFAIDWSNFAARTNWVPSTSMDGAMRSALAPIGQPLAEGGR